jgi:adenosylcobinamide-phosphate guanylyltransferase
MCGGHGNRLDAGEKPLVDVGGVPMVDRVLDALDASVVDGVAAAVTPATPRTRTHLVDRGVRVLDTPGDGYVSDLDAALDDVGRPAVTVVADLPLLDPAHVDAAVDDAGPAGDRRSVAVCVPATLPERLGVSADAAFEYDGRRVVPTGLNVAAGTDDRILVRDDPGLAVNVNYPDDRAVAARLLEGE